MERRDAESSNVGNSVSELWAIVSEPVECPTQNEWARDFQCRVHGVFDDEYTAHSIAREMALADRARDYDAVRVGQVSSWMDDHPEAVERA